MVRALSLPPPWRGSAKVSRPILRQMAGLAGGDVAIEMRDDALRQVVGLDLASDRQRLQLRHQAPVSADDASDQPAMGEMVQPAFLAVALPGRIDQG